MRVCRDALVPSFSCHVVPSLSHSHVITQALTRRTCQFAGITVSQGHDRYLILLLFIKCDEITWDLNRLSQKKKQKQKKRKGALAQAVDGEGLPDPPATDSCSRNAGRQRPLDEQAA